MDSMLTKKRKWTQAAVKQPTTQTDPIQTKLVYRTIRNIDTKELYCILVYNSYCFRYDIDEKYGKPACAYVTYDNIRKCPMNLLDRKEGDKYVLTNDDNPTNPISLAHCLLFSKEECLAWNKLTKCHTGMHVITKLGLEKVAGSKWEDPSTRPDISLTDKQKTDELNACNKALQEYLVDACAKTEQFPYGTLNGYEATYELIRQPRYIAENLVPLLSELLNCAERNVKRRPEISSNAKKVKVSYEEV